MFDRGYFVWLETTNSPQQSNDSVVSHIARKDIWDYEKIMEGGPSLWGMCV